MPDRPAESTLDATCPARPEDEPSAPPADASTDREAPLDAGERAGDFVIEGVLGRGSFGTVYRAAHGVIGRRAAVKVLREQAAEARAIERFIDEARLVARLRHPNIVDVLGFGRLDDGRHYQVMDLIEGPTLGDFMREQGVVTLSKALPVLRGIASALDAVHRAGVAHSDLKPANVVLERREAELVPKLIDFGVARLIAPGAEGTPTTRRALVGTPRYMSPEQCRGHAVDARADAYAFGLLAYEMLTGRPPFSGDDALELMLKHTSEVPIAPSRLCASLPAGVDPIVLALLEKRPEQRPLELVPVVQELEAIASDQGPPSAVDRPAPRWWRAAPVTAAALAVVAAVILARGQRDDQSPGVDPAAQTAASVVTLVSAESRVKEPEASSAPSAAAVASDGGAPAIEPSAAVPRGDQSSVRRAGVAPRLLPTASPSSEAPPGPGLDDPENPFRPR